ncbi:MAG TPA: YigZ family protein [Spirochaetota bacterium]|nr:YigZ family protein [Spirochaetota bacterium]HOS33816.1 YigZ family protein [Spirochaetota bacterium]HOS56585.1 YigZ family protein [Spirochaetota bacterium]HPK62730.1 YigZ family protein [Spirochaetota bacterium]HQF78881.1 YigZ family protein [Spirochaetota bacterium]
MYCIQSEEEYILIEKKSKFITRIFIVSSEEIIENILQKIRKNEKGARHNCYAYRILVDGALIERKNDDGEPGGTAGAPMLSVLTGEDIVNALAVTTRYFGGIKLGTGGLASAYKKGVVEVLKLSGKIPFAIRKVWRIKFPISDSNFINYIVKKNDFITLDRNFDLEPYYDLSLDETEESKLKELTKNRGCEILEIKKDKE